MRKKRFTFTELLIVIAIIAILSFIVMPYYKSSDIKAKVNAYYQKAIEQQQLVINEYMIEGPPKTITFPNELNADQGLAEFANGSNWTACPNGVYIGWLIAGKNLGLPPNPHNVSGAYVLSTAAFFDTQGTVTTYCGTWELGDSNDIPAAYLPRNCIYQNMSDAGSCNIPTH